MRFDFFTRENLARQLLPGLVLVATLLLAFWPQWAALADMWSNSLVWTHGWLIAAVCLWTLLSSPDAAPALQGLSWRRALPLAALLPFFVFVEFAYIDLAQELLLPLIGVALAYALFGRAGVARYAFPLCYLLFAIPIWDVLTPTLQHITVWANELWLSWAGVPVSVNGDRLTVPVGVFNVEGGCSGSHFLVVALAVSILHARLWKMSRWMTLSAVLLAVSLALIANWIRVFTVIMRAIQTEMQTSLIKDHYWFGWFLFAGALLIYFLVMRYFDRGVSAERAASGHCAPAPRPLAYLKALTPALILLIALNAHSEWFHHSWSSVNQRIRPAPTFAGNWVGPMLQDASWHPVFNGATREVLVTYHNTQGPVTWYRGIYTEQHVGSKLVGYGNALIPEDWTLLSQDLLDKSKQPHYTSTQGFVLATTARTSSAEHWRVWSWYVVNGHKVPKPWQARLWLGLQGFTVNKPTQAGVVALAAPCRPDCRSADEQLARFKEKLDGDSK